jgi:altronate dehydratase small subunit
MFVDSLYAKKGLTATGLLVILELSITQNLLEVISMAGEIRAGADAIVMDGKDHVATCLRSVEAGETIHYRRGEEIFSLAVLEAVPFGHKIAIADIDARTEVRKYGEVIGRATTAIALGKHVHVHNIEGIRGRGDQAGNGKEASA